MPMTPTEFVDKLFLKNGVTRDGGDRAAAINEFARLPDTGDVASRARAACRETRGRERAATTAGP